MTRTRTPTPRAPTGLISVAKSRICVALLRCSSVEGAPWGQAPNSPEGPRLALLASSRFCSVVQTGRRSLVARSAHRSSTIARRDVRRVGTRTVVHLLSNEIQRSPTQRNQTRRRHSQSAENPCKPATRRGVGSDSISGGVLCRESPYLLRETDRGSAKETGHIADEVEKTIRKPKPMNVRCRLVWGLFPWFVASLNAQVKETNVPRIWIVSFHNASSSSYTPA